jgi:hypothetical protein
MIYLIKPKQDQEEKVKTLISGNPLPHLCISEDDWGKLKLAIKELGIKHYSLKKEENEDSGNQGVDGDSAKV